MHELSITQSIVDAVVDRMGDDRIVRVRLEVGKLSGVVVDSVRFCFDLVAEGTTLQGAELEVVQGTATARCRRCAAEFEVTDLLAICRCGGMELDVLSGQELMIKEVEVAG
jgi:hydrogenase nickel incorporation protein HypA/HybF